MSAKVECARIVVVTDCDPDTSWLEQNDWADRLEQYRAGLFSFVGVYLEAGINIPDGRGWIHTTIRTPGLWGIEDDSGEDYLVSVAHDEYYTLRSMLNELCIPTPVMVASEVSYQ